MKFYLISLVFIIFTNSAIADPASDCRTKPTKDEASLCAAIVHKDANSCDKIINSETRFFCVRQIADFSHHMFNSYTPISIATK